MLARELPSPFAVEKVLTSCDVYLPILAKGSHRASLELRVYSSIYYFAV